VRKLNQPKVLKKRKGIRDGIDEMDENKKKEKYLSTQLEEFPTEI